MSEAVPERRPSEPRVSLGVPELDEMLAGGLMPHRPYLLVGPAGTGKTALALQFLCEGVRRGERSLYVTLEDPPNEVRWNHRALRPSLDAVDVFDAIPDVMRYERVPFKDISAVREVVPFGRIPERIRQTPEFTSVEVTGTALEQMLRSEVQKHGYSRLVIDSLTALQYFCMKGHDPTVGAQTFLRFLTDLRTTTVLTIEAPLEDAETPERMLARGEIRLFRWELDGTTVRAIGVEKFRGSSHDVRLHPYRIGAKGIDVQIAQTISRDTRRIVEPAIEVALREEVPAVGPRPPAAVTPPTVEVTLAAEPLSQQIRDLLTLGIDVAPLRSEVAAALDAVRGGRRGEATARLSRVTAMAISLGPVESFQPGPAGTSPVLAQAWHRIAGRADRSRGGEPPTALPPNDVLARELGTILEMIPAPPPPAAPPPSEPSIAEPPVLAPARLPPAAAPAVSVPASAPPPVAPSGPPPVERVSHPETPAPSEVSAAPSREPAPVPEPSPPSGTAAFLAGEAPMPRRPARRPGHAAPIASIPEPPPLPTVARMPGLPVRASDANRPPEPTAHETAGRGGQPAAVTAPAPRRRRRVSATKVPATPAPSETGAAVEASPGGPASAAKSKRRTVRRKKAPPVVAASVVAPPPAEGPPTEAVPPSSPPEPPAPEPSPSGEAP